MSDTTISVIVPVYNGEKTLRRCLDSIVCQTYTDLEIILVDNGSEDKSGAICDEYAARDGRIKVIHKENGGVSSSRNAGLAVATGQWIGWVDSDDWIEPDMYEYLLKNTLTNEADIGICGWFEHTGKIVDGNGAEQLACLDTEQALASLLADVTVKNHLWNKLWKKELFRGIRFPGRWYYEDISTVYRLFEKAKRTVLLPEKKYHYMHSPRGLMEDKSLAAELDYLTAVRERFEELSPSWPQFSGVMEEQVISAGVKVWQVCGESSRAERKAQLDALRGAEAFSRDHCGSVLRHTLQGKAGRIQMWLTQYACLPAFELVRTVEWLYRLRFKSDINEE